MNRLTEHHVIESGAYMACSGPCGDDVTLEYNGLLYKGDHWNPPTLTAFAADPSARYGRRLHWFGIEDAEKALEGME